MTDHDNPSIHANDPSVQVYFGDRFANDSQFPLEPGMDAVAWIEGGSVVICPLDRLEELPDGIDGPPSEAVPATHRDLLADAPDYDPNLVPGPDPDPGPDSDRDHDAVATDQTDTEYLDP